MTRRTTLLLGRRAQRWAVVGVVVVAAFALTASLAWATGNLDQQNPGPSPEFSAVCGPPIKLGQTFTAGLTGSLDTVELALSRFGAASGDDAGVTILGTDSLTNPGFPDDGDVLATQAVPHIDSSNLDNVATVVFDDPASITAGTKYTIVMGAPTCTPALDTGYAWGQTPLDTYAGGKFCVGSGGSWDCNSFAHKDLIFATFVTTPPPPPSADVAVSMTGAASAKKGAQVTYVITVSNAGPDTAHNVVLTNPIPSGASFLGVATTKGTCTPPRKGGSITCALGGLASGNGSQSSVSVKVSAKVGSTIANLVSAQSTANGAGPATPDPQPSNNAASLSTTVTK